jgi:hypothetical protein
MADETRIVKESPIACDMSAIGPGLRAGHVATGGRVFRAAGEIRELPDGYAFRLPNESDVLLDAAEFVSLERLCCPFLGFALKEFIREEVGGLLGGAIDWEDLK